MGHGDSWRVLHVGRCLAGGPAGGEVGVYAVLLFWRTYVDRGYCALVGAGAERKEAISSDSVKDT